MSLTREVLSISSISFDEASQLHLPMHVINPLNMTAEDSHFLGRFFAECVSESKFYISSGPWKVSSLGADGVECHRCISFPNSILLRPSETHPAHLRAELMGSKIGSGTYGAVYKALSTLVLQPTGEVTAKKCSRVIKKQSHDKAGISNIERESEMGSQAGYLHMKMPVHASNESFTVSRYFADTIELFDMINNLYAHPTMYSTDKILRLVLNIMRAVKSQLHDRGIISRDIKPENILIRLATDEVFNIDLGFARLVSDFELNESLGTWGYSSPEVYSKTGMSVKSDIFSLGVTISLLLGANQKHNEFKTKAFSLPDLTHLFSHAANLNDQERKKLRAMLESMMAINPDERMSLNQAILIVEEIILNRKLAKIDVALHADMNRVYQLAVTMRNEIDLSTTAIKSYSSMDPSMAMDDLIVKLKTVVSQGVASLPDHPEVLKLFAMTLQSERLSKLTTKAAIQAMIDVDIAEYESKKLKLETCRNELARRFDGGTGGSELADKLQQELGLIIMAVHLRFRRLAPTIDNLPVIMKGIDKSLAELQQLNSRIDEALAQGVLGSNVTKIGLFRFSPEQLRRSCRGQNPSISMKNRS